MTSEPELHAATATNSGRMRLDKAGPPARNRRETFPGGQCKKTCPGTRYAGGMRNLLAVAALLLAFVLGVTVAWNVLRREPRLPDAPALVLRIREVARLETLDVSLYKKIDFSPDPREQATVWASLAQWASYTLRP